MPLKNAFYTQVMPQLPKKWMSHFVGSLAHQKVPGRANQLMIKAFADFYKIDTSEAEKPLGEYQSIGDFFSRKLKSGARPIESEMVHPCDSLLVQSGVIHENVLIQAKGKTFNLEKFIPENPWLEKFDGGSFFNYYLAPHNYHRVHSPVSGKIEWSNLIPGELWPVNSWSVKNKEGLYSVNERVAIGIETPVGKVIVVLVGATNVGAMSFPFDPNIQTNLPKKKEAVFREYTDSREIKAGEELGVFHLGSTVVALFEKSFDRKLMDKQKVLMGQTVDC